MDYDVGNLLSFSDRKYLLISVEHLHNMVPILWNTFFITLICKSEIDSVCSVNLMKNLFQLLIGTMLTKSHVKTLENGVNCIES